MITLPNHERLFIGTRSCGTPSNRCGFLWRITPCISPRFLNRLSCSPSWWMMDRGRNSELVSIPQAWSQVSKFEHWDWDSMLDLTYLSRCSCNCSRSCSQGAVKALSNCTNLCHRLVNSRRERSTMLNIVEIVNWYVHDLAFLKMGNKKARAWTQSAKTVTFQTLDEYMITMLL